MKSTEDLIRQLNEAPEPWRAIEEMCPGERIRVQFAMYLRHIAAAMKADPLLGLRLYETMENALEQQINSMIRPWEARVYRDGRNDGYREAEEDFQEKFPELFDDQKRPGTRGE